MSYIGDRKLSDVDHRYYLGRDSIDYDFFELDDIQKISSVRSISPILHAKSSLNNEHLSDIESVPSDDEISDNESLVIGRLELHGLNPRKDDAIPKDSSSSVNLMNCIAFEEENEDKYKGTERCVFENIEEKYREDNVGSDDPNFDIKDSSVLNCVDEEADSYGSVTPINFENSDMTAVTPCSLAASEIAYELDDNCGNYLSGSYDESKMALLVEALDTLKLGREIQIRNSSLRRAQSRKKNMTFSRVDLRRIERGNEILLRKIMAQSRPRPVRETLPTRPLIAAATVNRLKRQEEIERENYILFKKIQAAKTRRRFCKK